MGQNSAIKFARCLSTFLILTMSTLDINLLKAPSFKITHSLLFLIKDMDLIYNPLLKYQIKRSP